MGKPTKQWHNEYSNREVFMCTCDLAQTLSLLLSLPADNVPLQFSKVEGDREWVFCTHLIHIGRQQPVWGHQGTSIS